jgi:hypothetical protein
MTSRQRATEGGPVIGLTTRSVLICSDSALNQGQAFCIIGKGHCARLQGKSFGKMLQAVLAVPSNFLRSLDACLLNIGVSDAGAVCRNFGVQSAVSQRA